MQPNSYPGKFIVFDGLDGSGQSTQATKLVAYLNERFKNKFGYPGAHLTKEPTTFLIGGLIRSQLTHDWKSSPECLQLLFAADRAHHLEKEVIPLLELGVTVVSDRYAFSSFAFGGLELDRDWLFKVNEKFLLPDLTFFLKVSPRVCIERIKTNRFETTLFEHEEIMRRVWVNYQKLAEKFQNVHIINGERPPDKVFEEIAKITEPVIQLRSKSLNF